MKTQNKNRLILTVSILMMLTMSIKLSAQEAGRESVPASTENTVNDENSADQKAVRDYCRHEWSFWTSGGFSTFYAKPNFGEEKYRLGGNLGLGYSFHFSKHWSVMLGAEVAMYNGRMIVDEFKDIIEDVHDPLEHPINYRIDIKHYAEQYRLYALNLPLMVQFKTPLGENGHEFFAALGGKAGYPLSTKYEIKEAEFQTSGYYHEFGQWLFDQNDLGYNNQNGKIKQVPLNTGWSYMGTFEAGMKWKLAAPRLSLYTGVYFEYGFNEIRKDEINNRFLEYDYDSYDPGRMNLNSLLTSEYSPKKGAELEKFVDKFSTVALGLKVRLGITTCHVDKSYKEKNKKSRNDAYDDNANTNASDDTDPYRKGYRDAYTDVIEDLLRSLNNPKKNSEPVEQPVQQAPVQQPVQQAPAPTQRVVETQYQGDPLLDAEMRRATKEYGKLANVFAIYVDGYEVNQSELSPIMETMIDDKLPFLSDYNSDKYTIICEGHTCDLADDNYNQKLGQKRAEVVKDYLVKNGFNANNIITVSKGKSAPVVYNTSEYNRKLNRRVLFLIKEKK